MLSRQNIEDVIKFAKKNHLFILADEVSLTMITLFDDVHCQSSSVSHLGNIRAVYRLPLYGTYRIFHMLYGTLYGLF